MIQMPNCVVAISEYLAIDHNACDMEAEIAS